MLAGSHRNAWPDETGTGGRTNRNTQKQELVTRIKEEVFTEEALDEYWLGKLNRLERLMGVY